MKTKEQAQEVLVEKLKRRCDLISIPKKVFGETIKGVEVRLTLEELQAIITALKAMAGDGANIEGGDEVNLKDFLWHHTNLTTKGVLCLFEERGYKVIKPKTQKGEDDDRIRKNT